MAVTLQPNGLYDVLKFFGLFNLPQPPRIDQNCTFLVRKPVRILGIVTFASSVVCSCCASGVFAVWCVGFDLRRRVRASVPPRPRRCCTTVPLRSVALPTRERAEEQRGAEGRGTKEKQSNDATDRGGTDLSRCTPAAAAAPCLCAHRGRFAVLFAVLLAAAHSALLLSTARSSLADRSCRYRPPPRFSLDQSSAHNGRTHASLNGRAGSSKRRLTLRSLSRDGSPA